MAHEFQLSIDARGLIRAFEAAPARTREMVRLELKQAAEDIKDYASDHHRYTTRRGNLERNGVRWSIVESKSMAIIELDPRVSYAVPIHEGYKAFNIVPRKKKALRWALGGDFIFAKRIRHPEWKPDPFLYEAADAMLPEIEKNFSNALQDLLEDL